MKLNKRLGDFQPELREMRITAKGIVVGKKLEKLRRVLTGVPEYQALMPACGRTALSSRKPGQIYAHYWLALWQSRGPATG